MKSLTVTVTRETGLDEALLKMDGGGFRHLPVIEGDRLVGMVSDRDLLAATGWLPARIHATRGLRVSDALPKTVAEVMSPKVRAVDPLDSVHAACSELVYHAIGSVPVVKNDKLVGIVTEPDILSLYVRGDWGAESGAVSCVGDCMTTEVKTISWDVTLGAALTLCREEDIRHLPVVENERLVGILSDRDLRRALGRGGKEDTRIDDYVTNEVLTSGKGLSLREAAGVMVKRGLGALPVVERGSLVGILTTTDVLQHALEVSVEGEN